MIKKVTLSMLDMTCIEDYFDFILNSKINNHHIQARELYKELSEDQCDAFYDWVETTYYYEADDMSEYITEMQNLKNYFK